MKWCVQCCAAGKPSQKFLQKVLAHSIMLVDFAGWAWHCWEVSTHCALWTWRPAEHHCSSAVEPVLWLADEESDDPKWDCCPSLFNYWVSDLKDRVKEKMTCNQLWQNCINTKISRLRSWPKDPLLNGGLQGSFPVPGVWQFCMYIS